MGSFCADDLWEANFSVSQSIPHLSTCFQHTVLVYVPATFLLLLLPILFIQAHRISRRFDPLPVTALFLSRLILNTFLLLNASAVLVLNTFFVDGTMTVDIIYPCVWMLFFILHLLIDWNRSRCGQISAGIQHLSFVLLALCGVPEFAYHIENRTFEDSISIFSLYMAFWPVVVLQTALYCWADKRSPKSATSAELDASFINRLTLWWFTTVQVTGSKKDLEMEDLFDLNRGSTSEYLGAQFEKYWIPAMTNYLDMKHKSEKLADNVFIRFYHCGTEPAEPSLMYALYRMFKYEFITSFVLRVIVDTLQFANPFLLKYGIIGL